MLQQKGKKGNGLMGVGRRRGEGGTRHASLIVLTFAETSRGYL